MTDRCTCGNDCPVWESKDDSKYICEMTDNHLANALRWLQKQRRVCSGYWPSGEIAQDMAQAAEDEMDNLEECMSSELIRRNINARRMLV